MYCLNLIIDIDKSLVYNVHVYVVYTYTCSIFCGKAMVKLYSTLDSYICTMY